LSVGASQGSVSLSRPGCWTIYPAPPDSFDRAGIQLSTCCCCCSVISVLSETREAATRDTRIHARAHALIHTHTHTRRLCEQCPRGSAAPLYGPPSRLPPLFSSLAWGLVTPAYPIVRQHHAHSSTSSGVGSSNSSIIHWISEVCSAYFPSCLSRPVLSVTEKKKVRSKRQCMWTRAAHIYIVHALLAYRHKRASNRLA